tara:strand:+ start:9958 stop:10182 length:225 start_codon:yes stop_codon:yes gene_type:complete
MKTKVIIDTEAALEHFNSNGTQRMNQKQLGELADISEQKLINWKTKAPKVIADVLKIQDVTGMPLENFVKEVPA